MDKIECTFCDNTIHPCHAEGMGWIKLADQEEWELHVCPECIREGAGDIAANQLCHECGHPTLEPGELICEGCSEFPQDVWSNAGVMFGGREWKLWELN